MNKTLFVKIDNTPVPIDAENEVVLLDCKQINDFCSFAGDALVGDLKDCNGTPFYRLINPVGRLLSDFEKVDKASYDKIIAQWLDILGEMLHKGIAQCDEQFSIHYPQEYVDWLLCFDNDYYVEIGKCLKSNESKVFLDANGISEDIISALHMKIRRFLNDNKDDIEYVVFSNERIGNSSHVIKQLKTVFDSYSFLRLEQWEQIVMEWEVINLEVCKAFHVDGVYLGEPIPEKTVDWFIHQKNGLCSKLEFQRLENNGRMLNCLLSCLMGKNVEYNQLSFNDICIHLLPLNFEVYQEPYIDFDSSWGGNRLRAILKKETKDFICSVVFYGGDKGCSTNVDIAKAEKGTLKSIYVEHLDGISDANNNKNNSNIDDEAEKQNLQEENDIIFDFDWIHSSLASILGGNNGKKPF